MSDLGSVPYFAPRLIALAIELLTEQPDRRLVALIGEKGTVEAADLVASPVDDILRGPDGSAAAIITRDSAKRKFPVLWEFLPDEGTGPTRTLPTVHASLQGVRAEGIHYAAPGTPPPA